MLKIKLYKLNQLIISLLCITVGSSLQNVPDLDPIVGWPLGNDFVLGATICFFVPFKVLSLDIFLLLKVFCTGFLIDLVVVLDPTNDVRVLDGKGSVLGNTVFGFVLGVESDNSEEVLVFKPVSSRFVDNLELDMVFLTIGDEVKDADDDIMRRPRGRSL